MAGDQQVSGVRRLFRGTIASYAPGELLRMIFGIIVILAAARMLFVPHFQTWQEPHKRPKKSIIHYMIWGVAVGVLSGLTGIGGGLMLVPDNDYCPGL